MHAVLYTLSISMMNNSRGSLSWYLPCAVAGLFVVGCQLPREPASKQQMRASGTVAAAVLAPAVGADAGGPRQDASTSASIEAYWDREFYASSDIQHSFDTANGSHIDCIPFGAQHSVRARVAHGLPMAPPPPAGVVPASAAAGSIPSTPAGNDGTADDEGNLRACPSGTVMATRPQVSDIDAAGGLQAYASQRRPRPQNVQNAGEHDCWNNDNPLNYTGSPPSNYCAGANGGGGWQDYPGAGVCGNYDHAVGIQTSQWLPITGYRYNGRTFVPVYSPGFYGASAIVPVYLPYVDNADPGEHITTQLWMQTGNCENWWNGNNGAPTGQQCPIGTGCTSENCAVQSLELGTVSTYVPSDFGTRTSGFVFYTNDGYFTGCYSNDPGDACPCYAAGGCTTSYCTTDSDCGSDQVCYIPAKECYPVNPYVEIEGGYYTPGTYIAGSDYGTIPYELPIEVWNGTSAGLPYYYIFMYGQWIGWYTTAVFDWPEQERYADSGAVVADAAGGGAPGPMVSGPATYLQAGGEVFQTWPYKSGYSYHSGTSMASDWPATSGYKYAAYVRNVEYLDSATRISAVDGGYSATGQQTAALTFMTQDTSPGVPEYMLDYNSTFSSGIPGVCGYYAGQFTSENDYFMWYDTSTSTAAGSSGWGTYFYIGTEGQAY